MNNKLYLVPLLLVALGGCASHAPGGSSSDEATAARDDDIVCERRKVVGSNFPQKICMTRAQREEIRERSQEEIRSIQASPMRAPTGS